MKITFDIPDDITAELASEAAEHALSIEGIALHYLRAGMLQRQAEQRAAAELAAAELAAAERALLEQARARQQAQQ